jgi:hypothetical protein
MIADKDQKKKPKETMFEKHFPAKAYESESLRERQISSFDRAIEASRDLAHAYQEEEDLLKEFFNDPRSSFRHKAAVIHTLIEDLARSNAEAIEIKHHFAAKLLTELSLKEKNFFLKNLAGSFLHETYPTTSLEEMKVMLRNNWSELAIRTAEETVLDLDLEPFSFGRKVSSVDDLTPDEVRKAAEAILEDDRAFFSEHWMQSMRLFDKYRSREAEATFADKKIADTILSPSNDCYDARDILDGSMLSPLSREFIAQYGDRGEIIRALPKNLPHTPLTLEDCRYTAQLLTDIDQAISNGESYSYEHDNDSPGFDDEDWENGRDPYDHLVEEAYSNGSRGSNAEPKIDGRHPMRSLIGDEDMARLDLLLQDPEEASRNREYLESVSEKIYGSLERLRQQLPTIEEISLEDRLAAYSSSEERGSDQRLLVETYKAMMSLRMREFIDARLGINLGSLSFAVQAYLLNFLSEADEPKVDSVAAFIRGGSSDAPESRLTSFLLLGQGGPEMGEKILSIAEKLPLEVADQIFAKYSELVDASESAYEYLDAQTSSETDDAKRRAIAREISDSLLRRGKDLLVDFSESPETDPGALLSKIESIKTDTELFRTAFKTLAQEGFIKELADAKRLEFSTLAGTEIPAETKEAMLALYDENYPEAKGYSPAFRELIFHGLAEAFDKEGVRFYTLKKDGKLIGFNRFEDLAPTEDGRKRKYVGSFNVVPELQGSRIGDVMFGDCLRKETDENTVIEAYADAALPVSSYYLEKSGFVATRVEDLAGRPFLAIRLDQKANRDLLTKQRPPSLETAEAVAQGGSPRPDIAVIRTTFTDMPAIASDKLGKNWLTHLLIQDKTQGTVLAVFEQKPEGNQD